MSTHSNNADDRRELDDVLTGYLAAGAIDSDSLDLWIERYPEYEQELTNFALAWMLSESLPVAPDADRVPDTRLVERGMQAVQQLLVTKQHPEPAAVLAGSSAADRISGLMAEARARGLRPRQFVQTTGLGDALLAKLDRRLIRFASIPNEVIERIASALQHDLDSVRQYLQQAPSFATTAAYRAEQAPQLAGPEDFVAAAASDSTMSETQRAYWHSLAPDSNH
jgi:DNA-binding LacI/PurR family transcriptional regulator